MQGGDVPGHLASLLQSGDTDQITAGQSLANQDFDLATDELSLFPVLYWPLSDAALPSETSYNFV